MKRKNLKVQILDSGLSVNTILNHSIKTGKYVTFIAYSDEMKARVLENIAMGRKILVVPTDEPAKNGEWLENRLDNQEQ